MVDMKSSLPDLSQFGISPSPASGTGTASTPYADLSTIGQDTTRFSGSSSQAETAAEKTTSGFHDLWKKTRQTFSRQSED